MATKKEWTVFFLMKAIGTAATEDAIGLLEKLEKINFKKHVNVIFCINFNREYLDALLMLDKELVVAGVNKNFTTMFFELVQDQSEKNRLSIIDEKEDFNITHPKDVEEFFRERVLKNHEAKKYLLFTWDHGDGFGIFSGIGQGGEVEPEEDGRKPILTMEELNTAIEQAFQGQKIDLMIMMNCVMQMIDTGFALQKNVKYLVAPQTSILFFDYDYQRFFEYLASDPENVTGETMSDFVIECFRNENRSVSQDISLSACNLSKFGRASNLLNKLAEDLLKRIRKGGFEEIVEAFKRARSVEQASDLVDLYSLLVSIHVRVYREKSGAIKPLLRLFDEKKMIVNSFSNLENEIPYDCSYNHHGLTVVSPVSPEPRRKSAVDTPLESYVWETKFMRETRWGLAVSVIDALDFPS